MKRLLCGLSILILCVLIVGCTEKDTRQKDSHDFTSAYNQAYQENYEIDRMVDILDEAKDSYVLLDFSGEDLSAYIEQLHQNGNEVSAYISVGTGEEWRDDFAELEPFLVEDQWSEWGGEYFVNSTATGIVEVMQSRIDRIAEMGFDWVEFDNMDWAMYDDNRINYGVEVTMEESIDYYDTLCAYAHEQGLKCMAKNMTHHIDGFEGVTFESFSDQRSWWDEQGLIEVVGQGKILFIVHYNESNCDEAYDYYRGIYGDEILFVSEDIELKKYKHYTIKR